MGRTRLDRWVIASAALVSGCSFAFVRGPGPVDARGTQPSGCTTQEFGPVIDSIFAGLWATAGTATAVEWATPPPPPPFPGAPPEADDDLTAAILTVIAFAGTAVQLASGIYGYVTTASCRESYARHERGPGRTRIAARRGPVTMAELERELEASGATARATVSGGSCEPEAAEPSWTLRGRERVTFEVVANCGEVSREVSLVAVRIEITNPGTEPILFPLDLGRIGVGPSDGAGRVRAIRGRFLPPPTAVAFMDMDAWMTARIAPGGTLAFTLLVDGARAGDELRLAGGVAATIEPERVAATIEPASSPTATGDDGVIAAEPRAAPADALPAPPASPPRLTPGEATALDVRPTRPGRAIRLGNRMSLTVDVTPIADEIIEADMRTGSFLRGLEVTLAFTNRGNAQLESNVAALIDGSGYSIVRYYPLDGSAHEAVGATGLELFGSDFGYRRTITPGGVAVRGSCLDNNPVSVADAHGRHIGLVILLCTAPRETDRVHLMFPRPRVPSRAVLEIRGCAGCPESGIAVELGSHGPTPGGAGAPHP